MGRNDDLIYGDISRLDAITEAVKARTEAQALRAVLRALVGDKLAGVGGGRESDCCVYCESDEFASMTIPIHAPDCPIVLGREALKGEGNEE